MSEQNKIDEIKAALAAATEIKGAPGYFITPKGEVISTSNWRGYGIRCLKQIQNSHGYNRVNITINGRSKRHLVHKLVADAFLPLRPSPNHEIRHLDGNRTNNNKDNLCWGTRKENAKDREKHGMTAKGSRNGSSKLKEAEVKEIQHMLSIGKTTKEISAKYLVSKSTIERIRSRKVWRHVG